RTGADGAGSASGIVCRSHIARRAAWGVTSPNTHEIPARDQSRDGESTWAHRACHTSDASRRGDRMRRREFITLLVGATASWPLAAHAQQAQRIRRVGVLAGGFVERSDESQEEIAAFRDALAKFGWTEGHNIEIEVTFVGANDDRQAYAAEMVRRA